MGQLTTHILDTSAGTPASEVVINLYRREGTKSTHIKSERIQNTFRFSLVKICPTSFKTWFVQT